MHQTELGMRANARKKHGRILKSRTRSFLKVVVASVKYVSEYKNKGSVLFVKKAITCCGLGLNLSGLWEQRQSSLVLQIIVKKYKEVFDRKPATTFFDLGGEGSNVDDK